MLQHQSSPFLFPETLRTIFVSDESKPNIRPKFLLGAYWIPALTHQALGYDAVNTSMLYFEYN